MLYSNTPEYVAFNDLRAVPRGANAASDTRQLDEQRILAEVGEWTTRDVLGPIAEYLVLHSPCVAQVIVPREPASASTLFHRPLELAHVNGSSTLGDAGRKLCVLVQRKGERPQSLDQGTCSHSCALQPTARYQSLALREERSALQALIREISESRDIQIRILQFGATYEAVGEALDDGDGWDIVHFAGHGLAASITLETSDGGQRARELIRNT